MVKQFLMIAVATLALSASAVERQSVKSTLSITKEAKLSFADMKKAEVTASRFDGSYSSSACKVAGAYAQWKRPAGYFWCSGYIPEFVTLGYALTPIVVRPWVEHTFENISTFSGTPSWACQYWSNQDLQYHVFESNEQNVTMSYLQGEVEVAPQLSYDGSVPYPTMYYKDAIYTDKTGAQQTIDIAAGYNFDQVGYGVSNPASSHYWSVFSREPVQRGLGIGTYTGAKTYDDQENAYWFGTNAGGINAMATRFEKPDQPYLLNSVYWYYMFDGDIPENIPMTAYVFKTANDAAIETGTNSKGEEYSVEVAELGELIAISNSFIPAAAFDEDNNFENAVKFEFVEKNPVTGAENAYSLEIEDDIIIVVTGFDANIGNGTSVYSFISTDTYDEGYGNLGFLGAMEVDNDGNMGYSLTALKNFFSSPLPNTVGGILVDVAYPWLTPLYDDSDLIKLPNEGQTTEETQGLQYVLMLASTSTTGDYDITYNGEEESDWLSITDVYDDYEMDEETGEEVFTGITGLQFEAAPNPNDENRTCKVTISIPAATYNVTFYQGSQNNAVQVIDVESNSVYYDLSGRRVANPEKGIYIKKSGNKAEKVIL